MDDVDDRIDGVDRITMDNDTIYPILKKQGNGVSCKREHK